MIVESVLLASLSIAAAAEPVKGRASVIDGDTLEVQGKRIRLWGIDAPESAQVCKDANGGDWRCGKAVASALDEHLRGKVVSCSQKDLDRYGRMVAVCRVGRNDLNGWLVSNGLAVAYKNNHTYLRREIVARSAKRGIHAGKFVMPWDWRRGVR